MNVTSITATPFARTNGTSSGASSVGLAVGLTFFLLLLVIVPIVIVYKCRSKIGKMQFGQSRGQKKEDDPEPTQDVSHPYTSMYRQQSAAPTPIYENLTRTAGYNRPAINQSRPPCEPEEDVYLQCDIADDAIYGNDPKCNLVIFPDSQEEDVYITPDS